MLVETLPVHTHAERGEAVEAGFVMNTPFYSNWKWAETGVLTLQVSVCWATGLSVRPGGQHEIKCRFWFPCVGRKSRGPLTLGIKQRIFTQACRHIHHLRRNAENKTRSQIVLRGLAWHLCLLPSQKSEAKISWIWALSCCPNDVILSRSLPSSDQTAEPHCQVSTRTAACTIPSRAVNCQS